MCACSMEKAHITLLVMTLSGSLRLLAHEGGADAALVSSKS